MSEYLELIIPILICNIIMFIFYVFLLIIVGKNYSNKTLPSQLKIELIIACILHQISLTPLFTTDNSKFRILCYIQVFLSIFGEISSLTFGLIIPNVIYRMLKSGEIIEKKKRKYHTIISLVSWGGQGIISFLLIMFSDPRFDEDSICWYREKIIGYIHPGLICVFCFLTTVSFFHLRKRIKQLILELNETPSEENYETGLNKFLYFVIACFLLNIVNFSHYFSNDKTFQDILLIIEDIFDILLYPFIATIYSLNYDNWTTIKSILCCQKHSSSSNKESINYRNLTIPIVPTLAE